MFYLSPSVLPSYSDLEEIIKSADGTVINDVPNLQHFSEMFHDERKTVEKALSCCRSFLKNSEFSRFLFFKKRD